MLPKVYNNIYGDITMKSYVTSAQRVPYDILMSNACTMKTYLSLLSHFFLGNYDRCICDST